jgi:hypothetical protein
VAQDQPKDWRKLCEAAAKEEDPDKLMALVAQINIALDESERKRGSALRGGSKIKCLTADYAA